MKLIICTILGLLSSTAFASPKVDKNAAEVVKRMTQNEQNFSSRFKK